MFQYTIIQSLPGLLVDAMIRATIKSRNPSFPPVAKAGCRLSAARSQVLCSSFGTPQAETRKWLGRTL